jgi:hypothetical protein
MQQALTTLPSHVIQFAIFTHQEFELKTFIEVKIALTVATTQACYTKLRFINNNIYRHHFYYFIDMKNSLRIF